MSYQPKQNDTEKGLRELKVIKVCCDTLERKDARVQYGDIKRGLEDMPDAKKIYLNPKIVKRLDGSLPEGIEVIEHGGVLSWEFWLEAPSIENIPPSPAPEPPPALPHQRKRCAPTEKAIRIPLKHKKAKKQAIKKVAKRNVAKIDVAKMNNATPFMQHEGGRGRPLKKGKVHRTTLWRRRKKMQGRLKLEV